jgi:DNA-binding transcriptional regulator YhcF (GntR family)
MFLFHRTSIDKNLSVPVGQQLYGLLAYAISNGDMLYGERLPSVRDLANEIGLAPMTVSKVYQDLRGAGLIEIRHGLGAYVAADQRHLVHQRPEIAELHRRIYELVDAAIKLSIVPDELLAMINSQMQVRRLRVGLRLVFVAILEGPARDYVEEIRPFLVGDDQVEVTTVDALRSDPDLRRRCAAADAVLTFVQHQPVVQGVLGGARVFALRFIPSEATRRALAGLDPRDRVVAVTRFQEYITIMEPSICQFAPHVSDIQVTCSDVPNLADILKGSDVIIYATEADAVRELLPPRVRHFEYRHAPDPGELARLLVPFLSGLRSERATAQVVSTFDVQRLGARPAPPAPASKNDRKNGTERPFSRGQ